MSHEQKKQVIEKYVARQKGRATQNDIVHYMDSNEVPSRLQSSRKTTIRLIKDLVPHRIKVSKAQRQGQSYHYSVNDESEFNKANEYLKGLEQRIDKLKIAKAEYPLNDSKKENSIYVPDEEVIIWDLLFRLAQSHLFPLEDSHLLERKIIRLLLAITQKKFASIKATRAQAKLEKN